MVFNPYFARYCAQAVCRRGTLLGTVDFVCHLAGNVEGNACVHLQGVDILVHKITVLYLVGCRQAHMIYPGMTCFKSSLDDTVLFHHYKHGRDEKFIHRKSSKGRNQSE